MEYINRKTVYVTQKKKKGNKTEKAETERKQKAKSKMVDLAFNISIIT